MSHPYILYIIQCNIVVYKYIMFKLYMHIYLDLQLLLEERTSSLPHSLSRN